MQSHSIFWQHCSENNLDPPQQCPLVGVKTHHSSWWSFPASRVCFFFQQVDIGSYKSEVTANKRAKSEVHEKYKVDEIESQSCSKFRPRTVKRKQLWTETSLLFLEWGIAVFVEQFWISSSTWPCCRVCIFCVSGWHAMRRVDCVKRKQWGKKFENTSNSFLRQEATNKRCRSSAKTHCNVCAHLCVIVRIHFPLTLLINLKKKLFNSLQSYLMVVLSTGCVDRTKWALKKETSYHQLCYIENIFVNTKKKNLYETTDAYPYSWTDPQVFNVSLCSAFLVAMSRLIMRLFSRMKLHIIKFKCVRKRQQLNLSDQNFNTSGWIFTNSRNISNFKKNLFKNRNKVE